MRFADSQHRLYLALIPLQMRCRLYFQTQIMSPILTMYILSRPVSSFTVVVKVIWDYRVKNNRFIGNLYNFMKTSWRQMLYHCLSRCISPVLAEVRKLILNIFKPGSKMIFFFLKDEEGDDVVEENGSYKENGISSGPVLQSETEQSTSIAEKVKTCQSWLVFVPPHCTVWICEKSNIILGMEGKHCSSAVHSTFIGLKFLGLVFTTSTDIIQWHVVPICLDWCIPSNDGRGSGLSGSMCLFQNTSPCLSDWKRCPTKLSASDSFCHSNRTCVRIW